MLSCPHSEGREEQLASCPPVCRIIATTNGKLPTLQEADIFLT
jgi:hypothetical protein